MEAKVVEILLILAKEKFTKSVKTQTNKFRAVLALQITLTQIDQVNI
jgi:hypothetical protein